MKKRIQLYKISLINQCDNATILALNYEFQINSGIYFIQLINLIDTFTQNVSVFDSPKELTHRDELLIYGQTTCVIRKSRENETSDLEIILKEMFGKSLKINISRIATN